VLPALPDPELFFGLVSPIGIDNTKAYTLLADSLRKYGYNSEYFKVTTLMKQVKPNGYELKETPLEDKYDTYINYANKIREILGLPYALAMLCCAAVRNFRREKKGNPDTYIPNTAYVFDQFKRKEEIDLLRQVYGRLFIVVALYSEKKNRIDLLINRIASDHSEARLADTHSTIATALMKRDQSEENVPSGQRLEEAFPNADLFLNIDDFEGAEKLLTRFLDALFGANSVSPTHDEYGMYTARSAALRSVDLSRQVGAAIFSDTGEVITLGCNEVPKALGGTYPKSYAEQLHGDAIIIGKSSDPNKVVFEPFIGIAPHRYRDLFARERRKNDAGDYQLWVDGEPRPIIKYTVATYVQNEGAVTKSFNDIVKAKVDAGLMKIVQADQKPTDKKESRPS
jgi:deoxycytidylate deaminase